MTGAILIGATGVVVSRHDVERIAAHSGACIATVEALYAGCAVQPRAAKAIGLTALKYGFWVPRLSIALRDWPRRQKTSPSLPQGTWPGGRGVLGVTAEVIAADHNEVA